MFRIIRVHILLNSGLIREAYLFGLLKLVYLLESLREVGVCSRMVNSVITQAELMKKKKEFAEIKKQVLKVSLTTRELSVSVFLFLH